MKKSDRFKFQKIVTTLYAVCPGGEVVVVKMGGYSRLARSDRGHGVEERVTSFRASRTFIDLHLLLADRMILLRTEHDRPAVFLEHLSHYARSETQTVLFLDIRPL